MLHGKSALVTGSLGGIGFVADENVGGPISFLCDPHGADTNGAALSIDGAWSAGR